MLHFLVITEDSSLCRKKLSYQTGYHINRVITLSVITSNGLICIHAFTCRVYLDDKLELGNAETKIKDSSLELLALELRFFGASVTDTLDEQTSHVIMDSE